MNNSIHVVLPAVIVAATAVLVLFVDLVVARRRNVPAWVAAAGLVAAGSVAAGQWTTWKGGVAVWRLFTGGLVMNGRQGEYGFNGMVRLDLYGLFFTILFCGIGVLTIMLSDGYLAQHRVKPRRVLRPAAARHHRHDRHGDLHRPHRAARLVRAHVAAELRARRLPAHRPALGRGRDQVLHQRRLRLGGAGFRPGARLRRHGGHRVRRRPPPPRP